ncbi:major facilitator superfamily domain-containing protein 6 [Nematostella vectensis]|uniref:major facilitator superfamily domain-containing protein 6 n=1 Tax=Nematostella vectensis TaxID=45351 RepID=UPI002076EE11|nr:major facilitator superfamily domain-containing protein 6 [Nematostella vectensis]
MEENHKRNGYLSHSSNSSLGEHHPQDGTCLMQGSGGEHGVLGKILGNQNTQPPCLQNAQENNDKPTRGKSPNDGTDAKSCKCCANLNTTLFIYKSFYFFFMAAIGSLFPYLTVFYKQIWLSARQTGILMGIKPLINIIATPMWGVITDSYKATKVIFIISLVSWLAANYSISLVSPVFHVGFCKDNATVTLAEDVLDDIEESMIAFYTLPKHHRHQGIGHNKSKRADGGIARVTSYDNIGSHEHGEPDVTALEHDQWINSGSGSSDSDTDQHLKNLTVPRSDLEPRLIPLVGDKEDARHVVPPGQDTTRRHHNIDSLEEIKAAIASRKVSRAELVSRILSVVESASNRSRHDNLSSMFQRELAERAFDFLNMEGHYPWPLDTLINYDGTQTSDEWEANQHSHLFTMLLVITMLGSLFSSPAITLADTTTLRGLGDNVEEYGRQRMWGSIGWGMGAFIVGSTLSYLQELNGCNNPLSVDYMPCFYAFAILMGVTILIGGLFEFEDVKRDETTLLQGLGNLCNIQYLYFILTMLFCGGAFGCLQTFLFWHLLEIGGTQFLFSAITAVQCVSEILMFSMSGVLIRCCGYQRVLYLGLICYAVRFFAYAFVTNCWLALPLECLHGVSYAAVWSAAVVFVGLIPGANNTMQGILGGVYWGVGFGGGGVVGGLMVSWLGSSLTFAIFGVLSVIDLIVFASVNNLRHFCRQCDTEYTPLHDAHDGND